MSESLETLEAKAKAAQEEFIKAKNVSFLEHKLSANLQGLAKEIGLAGGGMFTSESDWEADMARLTKKAQDIYREYQASLWPRGRGC